MTGQNFLEEFPLTGKREPPLQDRELEYRYLPEGDFKIIYHPTQSVVYIATVFDTRQDDQRLNRMVSQAEKRDWEE